MCFGDLLLCKCKLKECLNAVFNCATVAVVATIVSVDYIILKYH